MRTVRDLTGQVFGRLKVIERAANDARGNAAWFCECTCSVRKVVRADALWTGNTKSCGCRQGNRGIANLRGLAFKNGRPTPAYNSYRSMHERCENPNRGNFCRYGAVGIKVCERWSGKDGFINFLADMGERPADTTLGRFGDRGNYEPANCGWQTAKEQGDTRKGKPYRKLRYAAAMVYLDSIFEVVESQSKAA